MPSTPPAESAPEDADRRDDRPIPELVDWLVGALLVIVGLASVLGGAALYSVVDRSAIREAIADENVQVEGLSGPETVDVAQALGNWSAFGLIATGAILAIAGIAYVLLRRRTYRRAADGEQVSHFGANAVLGAVVAIVISFVPFSQVLGGLVAGHLESADSDRLASVGALSGVLAVAPVLAIALFVAGGAAAGLLAIGEGGLALVVVAALLLGIALVVAIGAGLGAIGGYLGGVLSDREREDAPRDQADTSV